VKEKKMENQITCPHCNKTISDDPLIDAAARKDGSGEDSIICECGERITYWAITTQLRDQKKPVARILKWFRSFGKG
jgi:hypothetical protein